MKLAIIILTGLSGSGKTVALHALEDRGYFCTDNLPPALIHDFIQISSATGITMFAIGIDIREKGFLVDIEENIKSLKSDYNTAIVFLEAEKNTLIRRFKETRRPHPLGNLFQSDIGKSIENEISILTPLRNIADKVIDTTPYSPHQLRDVITSIYGGTQREKMSLVLTSFGFKFGVPQYADMIFDVRFLPNPHFVPGLKDLTGIDPQVKDYVFKDTAAHIFIEKIKDMLDFLIPFYIREGKAYLNVCIGCTGGKHRSVSIVNELSKQLNKYPINLEIAHREL